MKILKITYPIGQTFLKSVLIFLITCALLESAARSPLFVNLPIQEAYGSSHPHLETQITRLKTKITNGEKIDCIFIGNSQILSGINPSIVEQTYFEETKRTIHCQNFGLGGMPPMTAPFIAEILIKKFHPSVIIFGTGLWDYSESMSESNHASILSSPWVKYQLGEFSIDGWLYENSTSYRLIFGLDRAIKSTSDVAQKIDEDGQLPYNDQTTMSLEEQVEYFKNIQKRPDVTEAQLMGLQSLMAIDSNLVKIIVVESSFNPVFLEYNNRGKRLYPDFKNILISEARNASVDLWMTQDTLSIPQIYWYDLLHLNKDGAIFFSQQMGYFLADVYISTEPATNQDAP